MCDSCIVQLNVAYNLKKNAIQSDLKLRQYMIEYGMNVTSYTTCSINTVSVIHPSPMIMPANSASVSGAATQPKPTSTSTEQRPFPVMPVVVKEEPIDYEVMSDITVETESFDDQVQNNGNERISSNGPRSNQQQKSLTPLPSNSMVAVNSKSLLLSTREASDSEYISAYMSTPSSSSDQSTTLTTSNHGFVPNRKKIPNPDTQQSSRIGTGRDKLAKSKKQNKKPSNTKDITESNNRTRQTSNKSKTKVKKDEREITASDKRMTRQNIIDDLSQHKPRELRTSGGSLEKKDYRSFYVMNTIKAKSETKKSNVLRRSNNTRTPRTSNISISRSTKNSTHMSRKTRLEMRSSL